MDSSTILFVIGIFRFVGSIFRLFHLPISSDPIQCGGYQWSYGTNLHHFRTRICVLFQLQSIQYANQRIFDTKHHVQICKHLRNIGRYIGFTTNIEHGYSTIYPITCPSVHGLSISYHTLQCHRCFFHTYYNTSHFTHCLHH